MLQEPTDLLPDCFIDLVDPQLLVPTQAQASKAIGIRANTAIIRSEKV
jgi:hypothetical protein